MDVFTTPRKKRVLEADEGVITPKKIRSAPLTPPSNRQTGSLPSHLLRLLNLHASIEKALLNVLSTASIGVVSSPTKATDKATSKGQMLNLLNHFSLETVTRPVITLEDLSRLVWLWEWDGVTFPSHSKTPRTAVEVLEEDNPFVVPAKHWIRGGMGLVVAPTTHFFRMAGKRVPAYGIGIQLETASGRQGDMSPVVRWTADSEDRRAMIASKLAMWARLCSENPVLSSTTSDVPYGFLPALPKSVAAPAASPSSRGRSADIFMRSDTPESAEHHPVVPDAHSRRSTGPSAPVRPNVKIRSLPPHLLRLMNLHTSVEQALSIALATASTGVMTSPSKAALKDGANTSTGRMINLINHLSLEAVGNSLRCTVDDLSRLVWLWEWDGETFPHRPRGVGTAVEELEADNPFLVPSKDWMRGGMGIVLTPTTYFSRALGKRVPAYGIGIQVDSPTGKKGGMNSIARWMASSEDRRTAMSGKLMKWVQIYSERRSQNQSRLPTPSATPNIPYASLPALGPSITARPSSTSPVKFPSSSTPKGKPDDPYDRPPTPQTPCRHPGVPPVTPSSSSRRAALFERVRLKSLTTPSKSAKGSVEITIRRADGEESTREIGPDEIKRRCLLGRLGGVAEAVWMLFSAPPQSPSTNPTPPTRRRRTIPIEEVVSVVVKSSRTPISTAEAMESLRLLTNLCPDFLKSIVIDKAEWIQMASSSAACPPSPSARWESEEEVKNRRTGQGTPVKIRSGVTTLRDVKERIRKELEG